MIKQGDIVRIANGQLGIAQSAFYRSDCKYWIVVVNGYPVECVAHTLTFVE